MAARQRQPAELEAAQTRLALIYEARADDRRWATLVQLLNGWVPMVDLRPAARVARQALPTPPSSGNVISFAERVARRRRRKS